MNDELLSEGKLRKFSILKDLSEEDLAHVKSKIKLVRFARGEAIITHQATDKDVYLLLDGQVLANRYSLAGREISYRRLPANSYMGELAVFDGQPRSVNIVAISPVTMGHLSETAFRELMQAMPALTHALLCDLAARIRELSDRIYETTASSVKMRFYSELVRAAMADQEDGDEVILRSPPTHAEWAAIVGGQRETITRALSELTSTGLLRKEGRDLVITDLDRLIDQIEEA